MKTQKKQKVKVWDWPRPQVTNLVWCQIGSHIVDQDWIQAWTHAKDLIWDRAEDQIRVQVRNQVRSQAWNRSTNGSKK
jgi:hypothetical protein